MATEPVLDLRGGNISDSRAGMGHFQLAIHAGGPLRVVAAVQNLQGRYIAACCPNVACTSSLFRVWVAAGSMEAHVAAAVCMLPGHTSCNELHGCAAVRVQALGDGPCHAGVWLSMRMDVCVRGASVTPVLQCVMCQMLPMVLLSGHALLWLGFKTSWADAPTWHVHRVPRRGAHYMGLTVVWRAGRRSLCSLWCST